MGNRKIKALILNFKLFQHFFKILFKPLLLKNGAMAAKLRSPFFLYSASAISESAELRINGKYFSAAFTPWISYASHAVCSSVSSLTNGSSPVILFPVLILSKNSSSITL